MDRRFRLVFAAQVGASVAPAILLILAGVSLANAVVEAPALMAVDADVSAAGVQASSTYPVFAGDIAVDVVLEGATSTGAFEFELLFDPLLVQFDGWEEGAFLGSSGRATECFDLTSERLVKMGCASTGAVPPGAQGSGVLATLHFRPLALGTTCLLLIHVETADVEGRALPTAAQRACLTFSPDSDGDGCSDSQEQGVNPQRGGLRDPDDRWDFFDVTHDRTIDLADAISILYWFGQSNGLEADLRDRRIPDGAFPWRTAEANDGIDLVDVLTVLPSFGHSCAFKTIKESSN